MHNASTISRTGPTCSADDDLLGASFFLKRGEGDRGFPTIVHSVRNIDAKPGVPKKALRDQFEKLILHPLG